MPHGRPSERHEREEEGGYGGERVDRRPNHRAAGGGSGGGGGYGGGGRFVERPSSELIALLRRTHAMLEAGELTADGDTIASLFDGVRGHEALCARHTFCSRALESLVRAGSSAQRRGTFAALLEQLSCEELLLDRYASHLADLLVTLAVDEPAAARDAPEPAGSPPSLQSLVVRLADGLAADAAARGAVCYDRYGAHCVQTLLSALSGVAEAKEAKAPFAPGGGGGGGGRDGAPPARRPPPPAAPAQARKAVPEIWRAALLRLCAALAAPDAPPAAAADSGAAADGAEPERKRGRGRGKAAPAQPQAAGGVRADAPSALVEMRAHNCASLVVQSAARALAGAEPAALPAFVDAALGWPGLADGGAPPRGAADALRALARTVGGSRCLEALLGVAPVSTTAALYAGALRGHLCALALDGHANFVVQRLFGAAKAKANDGLLGSLLGEIEPAAAQVVAGGRAGVLWRAVDAAVAAGGARGKEAFRVVARALAPASESARTLAHAVLALDAGASAEGGPVRPSALGSRLCQALLALPAACCQPLVASFHALAAEQLCALACDQAGSRAVEALFVAQGVPPAGRLALARKLRGAAARLARDRCGSHVLEKAFFAVDVGSKTAILDELVAAEASLESSAHAALVCKRLRLADYKRRKGAWIDEATANQKRRNAFAEILQADETGPADADAEAAEARALEQARGLGGDTLDALVAGTLGYAAAGADGGAAAAAPKPGGGAATKAAAAAAAGGGGGGGAAESFGFLGAVLGATGSDRQQRKKRKREREAQDKDAAGAAAQPSAGGGGGEAAAAAGAGAEAAAGGNKKAQKRGARRFSMN